MRFPGVAYVMHIPEQPSAPGAVMSNKDTDSLVMHHNQKKWLSIFCNLGTIDQLNLGVSVLMHNSNILL